MEFALSGVTEHPEHGGVTSHAPILIITRSCVDIGGHRLRAESYDDDLNEFNEKSETQEFFMKVMNHMVITIMFIFI